jgi:CBS domain-containing protein
MAMHAGANYVCILVGRLQDQGHDALSLIEQSVKAVNTFGYDTKIMFSSVRNTEHVRNAINLGAQNITVPYKILKQLTENNFTSVGHDQFITDTRLMTVKVKDAINGKNPIVDADTKLYDAIIKMTEFGFGCITVINKDGSVKGVFTDGDLRRKLPVEGQNILNKRMNEFDYHQPVSIDENALLNEAAAIFKATNVDTIVVTSGEKTIGMLDIQDLKR